MNASQTRSSAYMNPEVTVPLAELQDIGERYLPEVLRQFFISHGVGMGQIIDQSNFAIDLDIPTDISSDRLKKIKRLMLVTVPAFLVCSIAGAVAFASQAGTWDLIDDPVFQYDTVVSATPSTVAAVLSIYAISSSLVSELIATYLASYTGHWCLSSLALLSGIFSRTLFVGNCLSAILLLKAAPKLFFIGIAPFVVGIGYLGILLPIRTLVALAINDNFEITRNPLSMFKSVPSAALQPINLTAVRSTSIIPSDLERAASCPSNHLEIRRITHACVVFDWNFLFSKLLKNFLPFSIQSGLVLAASVKSYFGMLGYQLLLVPIYVFFIYDVCPNPIVIAAAGLSLASALLTCAMNVIPNNRQTIAEYVVASDSS